MNNNRLISRQEAAEILRCEQQTISNWVEWGIIQGHMINRRLMVDVDTIYAVLDSAKDAARAKKRIENLRNELLFSERQLDEQVLQVRNAIRLWKHSGVRFVNREAVYSILSSYKNLLNDMEISIIHALMEDGDVIPVATAFNLSPQRIVQILHRVTQKIRGARSYDSLIDEIASLKRLNADLRQKLANCDNRDDSLDHLSDTLQKNLRDTMLSVRAINACKANDIYNIADLVSLSTRDLLKFRNFGKKSLREIEELLYSLNLSFNMDVPQHLHSEEFKKSYKITTSSRPSNRKSLNAA